MGHLLSRKYEGMRWEYIPRKDRLLIAVVYPKLVVRVFAEWFRQVTVLPGDSGYLPTRDAFYVVTEVKPRSVTYELASCQMRHFHPDWPNSVPAGCVRSYETRARRVLSMWMPVRCGHKQCARDQDREPAPSTGERS